MITNDEMMVNCTMMRMELGILLRSRLTKKLEKVRTKITAPHITTEVSILVVTARAEQIPSTCNAMGLFSKSGSSSALRPGPAISLPQDDLRLSRSLFK